MPWGVFSKGTAKPAADCWPVLCWVKASAKVLTGTYFQGPDPIQYCYSRSNTSISAKGTQPFQTSCKQTSVMCFVTATSVHCVLGTAADCRQACRILLPSPVVRCSRFCRTFADILACSGAHAAQLVKKVCTRDSCRHTFWSFMEVTSCRKSGTPFLSGQAKPQDSKNCTTSSRGPLKTMRPAPNLLRQPSVMLPSDIDDLLLLRDRKRICLSSISVGIQV